ncbi:MAG: TPM domain-containing protein [Sphingomonadaceae bacterium]
METYLSESDHRRISEAVAEAESRTSGEIVTVLARQSDGYTDVALSIAAFIALLTVSLVAAFPDFFTGVADYFLNNWAHEWTVQQVLVLAAVLTTAKFAVVWLLLLWQKLRFALIPGRVKTRRVHERAIGPFKVGAERRTKGRTGILIYLSMQEHRAEIVADEAIASQVPAEVWGEAMADMLIEIKKGRIADGIIAGIRDVGAILADHFPPDSADKNELPDRLIEL